jgi:hypothetical protein
MIALSGVRKVPAGEQKFPPQWPIPLLVILQDFQFNHGWLTSAQAPEGSGIRTPT